jgi:hypothetical protein
MKLKLTGKVVYFLVHSAFLLSSCQGDLMPSERSEAQPVEVGIYAGGAHARTAMLENGLSAVWEAGDELAVWARNSAGAFALQNQIFKTYGLDERRGFFTSVLSEPMPEDTYTYFCSYPAPISLNGTAATFGIPSVQNVKASGGADVMIASPVQHGALTAIPDPEDHSGMSMIMNRMMHQFRFWVPAEDQVLGDEKIENIYMTFPTAVTGNVTFDVADLTVPAQLTGGQADVQLNLNQPIGRTSGEDYEYACFAFVPTQFAEGQSFTVKAYTDDKIAYFDPIDLKARNFQAGHSTPVMLMPREIVDFAGIIYIKVGANNLGENPRKITLTAPEGCNWGDGGSNVFVYEPGHEITVGETIALRFETDLDAYMAFSGKDISVTYDSENALLSETVKMPSITGQGKTDLSLTVPYLLFEDFSCVYAEGESYGNNSYSQDEREQPGKSLDGCMSHTGWNASRYWTKGNSIRINTRYQCVGATVFGYTVAFASYHHGRLDTPHLTGLKPGKTVNLRMNYDAGGHLHTTSNSGASGVTLCIASHTNAGVLEGVPTGAKGLDLGAPGFTATYDTSLTDFGSRQSSTPLSNDYGNEAFTASFPTYEANVSNATSATRLVFYIIFTGDGGISNAEFNAYIDNIKVQIDK